MKTLSALALLLAVGGAAAAAPPKLVFAPAQPTDSHTVFVTVVGDGCIPFFYGVPYSSDPQARHIEVRGYTPQVTCPAGPWARQVDLGHLAPGTWTVTALLDDQPYASAAIEVAASPTTVTLGSFGYFGANFRAEVEWVDPRDGETRLAPGIATSGEAGKFWFFAPGNPEVVFKVLDGSAINGHHWLFVSSMTGVEFTLRIRHCVEGDPPYCDEPKVYHSRAGQNLDVVDVEAFPGSTFTD